MTPKHNIILITTDQERFFSEWPEEMVLPARRRLAGMGVSFKKHYIASSVCTPSRSVMYTGQHVSKTHMFDNANFEFVPAMSPNLPTIGTMMREAGYYTAYKGKWHLDIKLEPDPKKDHSYDDDMEQYGFSDFQKRGDYLGNMNEGSVKDDGIAAEAREWLRTRGVTLQDEDKPWFLAVNFINPHDVMYFHPELSGDDTRGLPPHLFPTTTGPDTPMYSKTYKDSIPISYDQPIDEKGRPSAHAEFAEATAELMGPIPPEKERWERFRDYYYNCMADVDTHIGSIIDELEDLGFLENTTIIFTSDHGELQGSHGGLTNKGGFAYDYNCHVPFIICEPGGQTGVKCDAITSHLDLAPTVVGLSDTNDDKKLEITAELPGNDLSTLLDQPEGAAVNAIREGALFTYQMVVTLDDKFLITMGRMKKEGASVDEIKEALRPDMDKRGFTRVIIDGRYKYTRYFAPSQHNRPETLEQILAYNDIELFDTVEDPDEMINLATNFEQNEELILEMNGKLNRLIEEEIGVDDATYLPASEATNWFIDDFSSF